MRLSLEHALDGLGRVVEAAAGVVVVALGAREDGRAHRLRADQGARRQVLLDEPADAVDLAAGGHRDDEGVDVAVELLEELGTGGEHVRARVVGVGVLVGRVRPVAELLHQARDGVAPLLLELDHVLLVGGDGGVADQLHVGAEDAEQVELTLRHLHVHHRLEVVPLHCRHHRDGNGRVARGTLDDDGVLGDVAALLGLLDHVQGGARLDRPAGVGALQLDKDLWHSLPLLEGLHLTHQGRNTEHRRGAHQVDEGAKRLRVASTDLGRMEALAEGPRHRAMPLYRPRG